MQGRAKEIVEVSIKHKGKYVRMILVVNVYNINAPYMVVNVCGFN